MRARTLRTQLLLLVLAIALPLAGLFVYELYRSIRATTERAESTSLTRARVTAANAAAFVERTRQRMEQIAKRPLIRAMDPAHCDPQLKDFVALNPEFLNAAQITRDGERICVVRTLAGKAPGRVEDMEDFRRRLEIDGVSMSAPFVGPIAGKWVSAFNFPIRGERGELIGMLGLPVNLERFQPPFTGVHLEKGAFIHIVDENGTIVASEPQRQDWIGKNFRNAQLIEQALRTRSGTVRSLGLDGAEGFYAYAPIPGTRWIVLAGIPSKIVLAEVHAALIRGGWIALFVALGVTVATIAMSRRISRPIVDISRVARAVAEGQTELRAQARGSRETTEVAVQFNRMLDLQQRAAAELRESERRYRDMLASVELLSVMLDTEGRITYCNDFLWRLSGWTRDQILGRTWSELFGPPEQSNLKNPFLGTAEGEARPHFDNPILTRAGERRLIHWNNSVLRSASGEVVGTASIGEDITERRRAEDALRNEERRLRLMIDQTRAVLWTTDSELRFTLSVGAGLADLGLRPNQVVGSTLFEFFQTSDRQTPAIQAHLRALEGESVSYETAWEDRVYQSRVEPLQDPSGRPIGVIGIAVDVTPRKHAEEESRRFRIALDNSADLIALVDRRSMRFVDVNATACRLLGYSKEELLRMGPQDVILAPREELERVYDALLASPSPETGRIPTLATGRYRRKDGSTFPFEAERHGLRSAGGQIIVAISRDITAREAQEMRIAHLSRIQVLLSGINSAIIRIRDRDELFREACRLAVEAGRFHIAWIGVSDPEARRVVPIAWAGVDAKSFLDAAPLAVVATDPGGYGLAGRAVREKKSMISLDIHSDPQRLMRKELTERGINSLAVMPLIVAGEAVGVFALYSREIGFFDATETSLLEQLAGDVSFALDVIEKEKKLNYLAYYDSLTGLANRSLFHERLAQNIEIAAEARQQLALIVVDVDRFKTLNDTLGRQGGDLLLRQVTERIVQTGGERNRLARVGPDRFAVINLDVRSADEVARRVERRTRDIFGPPFQVGGNELRIAAKCGVALFPGDGADAETLFRNAETALNRAKTGGEPYLFFAQQMTERVAENLELENKLRLALERDEFVLHYQPKVSVDARRILGVEALIRWQSPERGLVQSMEFIPLLEETGLIMEVGAWALKRAALDHRHWLEQGLAAPRIAVNVSAIQLRRKEFVEVVRGAIAEGAPTPGIDFEITESLIMDDVGRNMGNLRALRELGADIAIDDFGTGYSSLGYLAKLPVQTLKIDRAFIITMLSDRDVMTLVETIVSLGHSLRLKVVAEGVDSEAQAKVLQTLRCDQLQGYLFSRPLPRDELTKLLRTQS